MGKERDGHSSQKSPRTLLGSRLFLCFMHRSNELCMLLLVTVVVLVGVVVFVVVIVVVLADGYSHSQFGCWSCTVLPPTYSSY